MNQIFLKSHANGNKPETVVEGECEGLAMRKDDQRVHYREDEDNPRCAKCGQWATVWHGSLDRWEAHPMRCAPVVYRSWRR